MDTGNEDQTLVPSRVQLVQFYGDEITAAEVNPGEVYVPVRPICEHLGLTWSSQYMRIKRDRVLAQSLRSVLVMRTEAGDRTMICLPLDMLPGWLFGVSSNRIREELQEKIDRYRAECFKVLMNAFRSDILPATPAPVGLSQAEQALETARALLHLAEQQVAFERALQAQQQAITDVAGKQQSMADFMRPFVQGTRDTLREYGAEIAEHDARLTGLELQLSAGATLDPAQQAEVQLAVKAVASALERTEPFHAYQKVYTELYRRYGISGYKQLPRAQFAQAMAWLRGWFAELGDGDAQQDT